MNYKILPLIFLSVLLFSSVSAVVVYADFTDGSQTKTISEGNSISFNADFVSMKSSMTISVNMYDSSGSLIHTFVSKSVSDKSYSDSFTYTISEAGTYEIRATGKDSLGTDSESLTLTVNEVSTPVIPVSTDTTKPVITILGSNPLTITQGDAYYEYGAAANDDVDGDITSKIKTTGTVNTEVIGTYTITYKVSDSAENQATATRTVYVVCGEEEDTTAPEITIVTPKEDKTYTDNEITIKVKTDESATVRFKLDDESKVTMDNVYDYVFTYDLDDLDDGDHTIIFYATDDAGNLGTESVDFSVDTSEEDDDNDDSDSGMRVISDDSYYQNKYYDQFETGSTVTESSTSKTVSNGISMIYYIVLGIVILGILIAGYILYRKIRE